MDLPPDLRRLIENGAVPLGGERQRLPIFRETIHYQAGYSFGVGKGANGEMQFAIQFDIPAGGGITRLTIPFESRDFIERFAANLREALDQHFPDET